MAQLFWCFRTVTPGSLFCFSLIRFIFVWCTLDLVPFSRAGEGRDFHGWGVGGSRVLTHPSRELQARGQLVGAAAVLQLALPEAGTGPAASSCFPHLSLGFWPRSIFLPLCWHNMGRVVGSEWEKDSCRQGTSRVCLAISRGHVGSETSCWSVTDRHRAGRACTAARVIGKIWKAVTAWSARCAGPSQPAGTSSSPSPASRRRAAMGSPCQPCHGHRPSRRPELACFRCFVHLFFRVHLTLLLSPIGIAAWFSSPFETPHTDTTCAPVLRFSSREQTRKYRRGFWGSLPGNTRCPEFAPSPSSFSNLLTVIRKHVGSRVGEEWD